MAPIYNTTSVTLDAMICKKKNRSTSMASMLCASSEESEVTIPRCKQKVKQFGDGKNREITP